MVPISQMKSPGIFIDEIDLSAYTAVMDTSKIFGLVLVAQNGPIGEVVPVTKVREFEEIFGYPISDGGLTARFLLEQTSSVKIVRAASSSATARSLTLDAVTSSEQAASFAVSYKYKGTLFSDAMYATVTAVEGATADKFNLKITKGSDSEELLNKNYTCVASQASKDFPYIFADDDTDFIYSLVSGSDIAVVTPVENKQFSTGSNGTTLTDDEIRKFIDVFDDAENIDLDILAAPGWISAVAIGRLVTVAQNRQDIVSVVDPPQGLSPKDTVDFFNGLNEDYPIQKVDSSFATYYSPWGKVYDEYEGVNKWVPPTVGILPAMAYEYSVYDNWIAPAGIPRLTITVFSEMERLLNRNDRDILYSEGNVNPICNYKQRGLTAFGQKTSQRSLTATNRLNVRFLVNYIKRLADYASVNYLFSEINENTFDSWTQAIDRQLSQIKARGGMYDYKITMDWTTVTDEMLNNNIMPGVIQIKPTKTAEFIPIDVVIRNKSDNFD